ncbi:MAG: GH25 family lysozyme, partial [Ruthenibacterium sp.]
MAATIFQNGIDVSRYQGSIQWPRVAAAGKQFVIARAVSSGGDVYEDPSFETNYQGARAAGLRVGAYYYTYAQNTAYADREIALLSNVLRGKQLQYPVFIDVEERRLINLGRAQ